MRGRTTRPCSMASVKRLRPSTRRADASDGPLARPSVAWCSCAGTGGGLRPPPRRRRRELPGHAPETYWRLPARAGATTTPAAVAASGPRRQRLLVAACRDDPRCASAEPCPARPDRPRPAERIETMPREPAAWRPDGPPGGNDEQAAERDRDNGRRGERTRAAAGGYVSTRRSEVSGWPGNAQACRGGECSPRRARSWYGARPKGHGREQQDENEGQRRGRTWGDEERADRGGCFAALRRGRQTLTRVRHARAIRNE